MLSAYEMACGGDAGGGPIFSSIGLIDRIWIVFGKQGLCFLFSFNKIVTEQQRKKYGNKFD